VTVKSFAQSLRSLFSTHHRLKRRRRRSADPIRRRREVPAILEGMERRLTLTVDVSINFGGDLVVADAGGSTDDLTISTDAGDVVISDTTNNIVASGFSGNGSSTVRVPISSITSSHIQINAGAGDDSITIGSSFAPGSAFSVNIDGEGGTDTVTLDTALTILSMDVNADAISVNGSVSASDNVTLSAADDVTINASVTTTGSGAIDVDAGRSVNVTSGVSLSTINGNITIDANASGTGVGNFSGISLSNADITATDGNITLTGRGGDTGANNYGVHIDAGSTIGSTGTGATAGTITVAGTGGSGTDRNRGVFVNGSGSKVTSIDGNITIDGTGGAGSSNSNHGVRLQPSTEISSTGTMADAADIIIEGSGGSDTNSNYGFESGGGSVISKAGHISITGTTGSGTDQNSMYILSSSVVAASEGGDVSLTGIGAQIKLQDATLGSTLGTATGAITITANGLSLPGTTEVIQGGGTLTIKPLTASTTIGIGGGSGTLNLDSSKLDKLADGFSSITIGDMTAGLGAVDVDSSTFIDPVTIAGSTIAVTELDAGTNDVTLANVKKPFTRLRVSAGKRHVTTVVSNQCGEPIESLHGCVEQTLLEFFSARDIPEVRACPLNSRVESRQCDGALL